MADEKPVAGEAQPIQAFGAFFKNYALGLGVVVAALPIAALKFDTIPQYNSMKSLLAILGSGSSFLLVGVIFAQRHGIARLFFPWWREKAVARSNELRRSLWFKALPIALSLISLVAIVSYFATYYKSFENIAYRNAVVDTTGMTGIAANVGAASHCAGLTPGSAPARFDALVRHFGPASRVVVTCSTTKGDGSAPPIVNRSVEFFDRQIIDSIRTRMPAASVPYETPMNFFFFLAFTTASAAFVLTGLKDYLQKELGFTDKQLIRLQTIRSRQDSFDVEGVPGVFGTVDYTPGYPDLATPSAPLCVWHHRPLMAGDFDKATGKTTRWYHQKENDQILETDCEFDSPLTQAQLERRYRASWEALVRGDAPPPLLVVQQGSATSTAAITTGAVASAGLQSATNGQANVTSPSLVPGTGSQTGVE